MWPLWGPQESLPELVRSTVVLDGEGFYPFEPSYSRALLFFCSFGYFRAAFNGNFFYEFTLGGGLGAGLGGGACFGFPYGIVNSTDTPP